MRDLFAYKDKCVVITGAVSGIGESATRLLVELAKNNICIKTVNTGTTQTAMTPAFYNAFGKELSDSQVSSVGRYATPERRWLNL